MILRISLFLLSTFILVHSFGGEDRFIRKYAMMKIYESCFGSEVVKQIRKEMKAACMKCASLDQSASEHAIIPTPSQPSPAQPPKQEEGIPMMENENSVFTNAQLFGNEKFNPTIIAYRPNPYSSAMFRPFQNPGVYPAIPPQAAYFPTPYQQPHPFAAQNPYVFPFLAQRQYYAGQRMARNMDIKSQLEQLSSKLSSRGKNVTCVMQELGYLNENLEPNYVKIQERIGNLPIPDELRSDIQDGVSFCRQFSQCVPEVNKEKSPLSRELVRPMFFFKCYKHKKLEACITKDIREKYAGIDEDFDGEMDLRRHGKDLKTSENDIDELASSMYEFLYGSDSSLDLDTFL